MSDAAPPLWIRSAPGLSAAHKFMLGVLWGYGPYNRADLWVTVDGDRQPRTPTRCWEPCAVLAEMTAQPIATVRNQLRKLAAAGWFLSGKGSMRTLAWRAPGVFAYGALATDGHPLATSDPGQICTPPGHEWPPPGQNCTPKVAIYGPQTFQEHSNSTSRNVEERVATPTPSENTSPDEVTYGPDDPGRVPRPNPTHAEPLVGAAPPTHAAKAPAESQRADPECDAEFGAQLEGVSDAARLYWLSSSTHPRSWSPMANERRLALKLTWAQLLAVCRVWEAAPAGGDTPPIDDLWQRKHSAWVARAAGIEQTTPSRALQRSGHNLDRAEFNGADCY